MRRHDKEVTSREEIDRMIETALVCRIAFADDNEPYIVPVSFGYDGRAIFLHTARTGRKLDFIAANNRVCFELEARVTLLENPDDPCAWSFAFESVVGYGTISELTETADKAVGLNHIMRHYSGHEWDIGATAITTTRVWRIEIESVSGKRSNERPVAG